MLLRTRAPTPSACSRLSTEKKEPAICSTFGPKVQHAGTLTTGVQSPLMPDDNMNTQSILEELLLKRSQQKKKMSPNNYKERLFVLTKTNLSYYEYDKMVRPHVSILLIFSNLHKMLDYNEMMSDFLPCTHNLMFPFTHQCASHEAAYICFFLQKRGSRKGMIEIKKIRCVEKVNLEEQTPVERQYPFQVRGGTKSAWRYDAMIAPCTKSCPFQIVYKDGLLYVYASNEESRKIRGNPHLLIKYHSGFFVDGKFLCCEQSCKAAPGCTLWDACNVTPCWAGPGPMPIPRPIPYLPMDRPSSTVAQDSDTKTNAGSQPIPKEDYSSRPHVTRPRR
ncbi:Cytoplasmic tyrosine-protein kinase BMX [Galemys pyrenaicus]|uniref:Cytoplasmic tyrosine-protein kinase BMX n=1 Tax=Galemys pyrenaicus TaxID=202257 RepID=A0A8J6DVF9_GALPY|nr:Cytoplasmic tyrosine-protein kinase BMX [Galemys pyrenaicus]